MLAYLPLISSATHKLKLPLMLQVGEIVGSSFMVGLIVGFCVGTCSQRVTRQVSSRIVGQSALTFWVGLEVGFAVGESLGCSLGGSDGYAQAFLDKIKKRQINRLNITFLVGFGDGNNVGYAMICVMDRQK